MITGWVGTGLSDTAIAMPAPERKLYLRAGGRPLVNHLTNSVPFPTREIEERQLITLHEGSTFMNEFGWNIEFQRNDAYGSAIVEMEFPEDVPLSIEYCPDVTNESDESIEAASIVTNELSNPVVLFTDAHTCGVLAVVEE